MKRFLFFAAFAAAALVSCNKAEVENYVPDTANAVKFKVENLGMYSFDTKAVAIGEEGTSSVGIFASELNATNVEATVAGTALTPTSPIYWGVGQTSETTFCAVYPYAGGRSATTFAYEIPADQSNVDAFTYQDNLITAVTSAKPSDAAVAFTFKHPFAKMVININNKNAGGDVVSTVVVEGLKGSTQIDVTTVPATVDLADATSVVTPYAVSAATQATLQYALVFAPQEATPAIVVTTALGSVYRFNLSAAYTFEAGKVASTSLTLEPVGGGGSGITQTAVENISFTADPWGAETNASSTNGETTYGDYWYAIGTIYGTDNTIGAWSNDFPMTYNADGSWAITINYDESIATPSQGLGLKFRKFNSTTDDGNKWDTQYGMWASDPSTYMNIDFDYNLATAANGNKNIRFEMAGNYTLTLTGNNLIVVKND